MVRAGSAWRKNNSRELLHTLGRFLAIFAIVALGVGFFAGIQLARPAMAEICRDYLEETRFYDFQLVSTLGLTEEDRAYFAAMDGVAAAEGSITADLLTTYRDAQTVFKTNQLLDRMNHVQLTAGRMPEAANECLGDDLYFTEDDLGAVLTVENDEDDSVFTQEAYTVVGLCNSPQYLNLQRGTTSLGNGTVAAFLFLPAEAYEADYYTEIYLRMEGEHEAFQQSYADAMAVWEDPLTEVLELRGSLRKDDVVAEAEAELADYQKEYDDGYREYLDARAEADEKFAEAEAELNDAKQQIDDGRQELEDGEATLAALRKDPASNEELAAARKKLDDGWKQLENGEAQYQKGLTEYNQAKAEAQPQLDEAKQQLDDAKAQLEEGEKEYNAGLQEYAQGEAEARRMLAILRSPVDQLAKQLQSAQEDLNQKQIALARLQANPDADPAEIAAAQLAVEAARTEVSLRQAAYEAALAEYNQTEAQMQQQLDEGKEQLLEGKAQLDEGRAQYEAGLQEYEDAVRQLDDAKAQLDAARAQLASSRKQLEDGEQEYREGYETALDEGRKALDDGWAELEDAEQQYEDGLREYLDQKAEAEEEFADAKAQLDDAKYELADAQKQVDLLKTPSYYALDRMANNGYASFDNDTSIVAGIAKVFPFFFFLVAALVCSSTMTRMVEEQRTHNGTLKALGYSDLQIMWRYASYAGGASLLGCVFGFLLGSWLFPYVIWHAYGMLYHFGEIRFLFDWKLAIISILVSLLCSVGAACAAAWSEMRQMPAELMRPKAPKAGKRIFLEYLTPLWRRLSFLQKVAARNIFRYKKRLIMMMLGVGGCMALLIAGLGLKNSISNVINDQFGSITTYDFLVSFRQGQDEENQEAFRKDFEGDLSPCVFVSMEAHDALTPKGTKSVYVVAADDPDVTEVLGLYQDGEDLGYPTGDGAFISQKLAELAGLEIGDCLTIQLETKELVEIPITGIFENYVYHYLFLTMDGYEHWFGQRPECNTVYAATASEDLYEISSRMQSFREVVNVNVTKDVRDHFNDTISSLNAVIALVVGCALALSFVVTYNLININITERAREIATVKVLGFYQSETYSYVFREGMVLTAMGACVGVPLGIWLHRFVMSQIQVDFVTFPVYIAPWSFAVAVALTFVITLIVDWLLRGKIDKINMAESLKSVE